MPLFILPFPAIDPVLIEIGPFAIRWYALGYIAGIFLGWWYAKRLAADWGLWGGAAPPIQPSVFDDFVLWATLGIVLGGRLGYVLFYDLPDFLAQPMSIFAIWQGGMSFHGGFLGVTLATLLFTRRHRLPLLSFFDLLAPSATFGIFLVRLANFINGELWGNVTAMPWGMVFPNGGPLPRHPSQLYEAGLEGIALFLLLRFLTHGQKRLAQPGFVCGAFVAGYGCVRIFIEFFRQPDFQIGYLVGPLTLGMTLSIPMVLLGLAFMAHAARKTSRA